MKTDKLLVLILLIIVLPLLFVYSYIDYISCPCYKPSCMISRFQITSCKYENGSLKLTLQNQGFADIKILNAYFIYQNGTGTTGTRYSKYLADRLPAFQKLNFEAKGVSPGFESVIVTISCNRLNATISSEKCK